MEVFYDFFIQMNNINKINVIKDSLWEPYFEIPGKVLLYKMDCTLWMKKMPAWIVDTTITSPPYNIGKEYEEKIDLEEYLNWTIDYIDLIYNVTKDNWNFMFNVWFLEAPEKWLCVPIPYLMWDKTKFYMIQEIIWNYWAGVACKNRLSPRNEKIIWYTKNQNDYTFNLDPIRDPNVKYPNQKKNWKLRCNQLWKNPSDVRQIAKVTSWKNRSSKERAPHPAQFPMELIDRLVKWFSNVWDLILDPFIGSCTTAEVAINNDRLVVWFELLDNYLEYWKYRILKAIQDKQSKLF